MGACSSMNLPDPGNSFNQSKTYPLNKAVSLDKNDLMQPLATDSERNGSKLYIDTFQAHYKLLITPNATVGVKGVDLFSIILRVILKDSQERLNLNGLSWAIMNYAEIPGFASGTGQNAFQDIIAANEPETEIDLVMSFCPTPGLFVGDGQWNWDHWFDFNELYKTGSLSINHNGTIGPTATPSTVDLANSSVTFVMTTQERAALAAGDATGPMDTYRVIWKDYPITNAKGGNFPMNAYSRLRYAFLSSGQNNINNRTKLAPGNSFSSTVGRTTQPILDQFLANVYAERWLRTNFRATGNNGVNQDGMIAPNAMATVLPGFRPAADPMEMVVGAGYDFRAINNLDTDNNEVLISYYAPRPGECANGVASIPDGTLYSLPAVAAVSSEQQLRMAILPSYPTTGTAKTPAAVVLNPALGTQNPAIVPG